jgi:hypothetical protein
MRPSMYGGDHYGELDLVWTAVLAENLPLQGCLVCVLSSERRGKFMSPWRAQAEGAHEVMRLGFRAGLDAISKRSCA